MVYQLFIPLNDLSTYSYPNINFIIFTNVRCGAPVLVSTTCPAIFRLIHNHSKNNGFILVIVTKTKINTILIKY